MIKKMNECEIDATTVARIIEARKAEFDEACKKLKI